MDNNMLRKALWGFLRPLIQLVTNLLNPDKGEEWLRELKKFLRKEQCWITPEPKWSEENGVIYFSVTSDGTIGPKWIKRLEKQGFHLSRWARDILNSPDFKPTSGVTSNLAVLKGELFEDRERVTKNIRRSAYSGKFTGGQQLSDPNAEVACLIREKFTDEEIKKMGLWWIIAMHEPIKDSVSDLDLLSVNRYDDGCFLSASWGVPDARWDRDDGFAFVVSQVSS